MTERVARVRFPVAATVAWDYLVDPRNRPLWQSSLRGVEVGDPTPVVGLSWIDVTRIPGIRPRMRLVEAARPDRWVEEGSFRGFSARLALDFTPSSGGCEVTARFSVHGWAVGGLLTRVAVRAVRADLERAATIVSG